jgi:hypothetical protein
MAHEQKQRHDEIDEIFANDPNANVVEGEQQAWLLTGDALNVAKAAIDNRPEN